MIKKVYTIFYNFGMTVKKENIRAYASSSAFFFFMSFVPLLLVVCSIIPFTPITRENIIDFVNLISPTSMDGDIVDFIDYIFLSSSSILPVAVIIALWSASQGIMGLQTGLNVINGVVEGRNYLIVRLEACFYTLITLVGIILTFLVALLGKKFLKLIYIVAPNFAPLAGYLLRFRFLFSWIILVIIFCIIYTWLPNKKIKLIYELPGSIIASIAWVIFSWLFSIYVDKFNGMSSYGRLSTIILALIWLYASMYIFFIGAELNKYFEPVIKVLFKKR